MNIFLSFQDSWRLTSWITLGFPIISFVTIYFIVPESPSWLISKNKIEAAEKSLSRIRRIGITSPKLKEEIEMIVSNKLKSSDATEGLNFRKKWEKSFKYFLKPVCMKPFLILVAFFFFQQASGTFVIVFYAVDIVKEAGATADPYLMAILIALSRTIATLLVGMVSRTYGRRPPTIISGAIMTICMSALALFLYFDHSGAIPKDTVARLTWLPPTLIVMYFFTSTFGFLTIPFAMIGELYPARARDVAGGLTACLCYVFNFVFVKSYLGMVESMGKHGVFGFYGGMALVGTAFVFFFLPETKGKTLQEIEEYFSRRKRSGVAKPHEKIILKDEKV